MSSIPSQPSAPPVRERLTAEAAGEQLANHLRQTAQYIRLMDIVVLLVGSFVGLLLVWLVGSIVDHWLVVLPRSVRWAIWLLVVGGLSWIGVTRLLPLGLRRISPAYAAARIEQLVPEFQNGLIAWHELESRPELGVPKGVMAALSYRAVRYIGGQEPASTIDTGPLIKLIGASLLLVVLLGVYAMLSPKSLIESGQRIAMPWRDIAAPTRVHFMQVSPGNVELTQGSPLEVEVEVRGLRENDSVLVRYDSLDGQFTGRTVALQASVEGLQYASQVRTGSTGIDHEIRYWVEAGDAVRGPYRVTLNPLPSVALKRIQIEYPKYTRLEPREYPSNVAIEALEGSTIHVWGTSNQRLQRARLNLNPEMDELGNVIRASDTIDLRIDDRSLEGSSKLYSHHQSFCLRSINARGDSNPHPVVVPLNVFSDVPPEVVLVGPESRAVRVGPSSRMTLEIRASDADFGLSKVQIDVKPSGRPKISRTLFEQPDSEDSPTLSRVMTLPLNIKSLDVRPGDRIEVVATALDNRHDPVTGNFSPNQRSSQPLILEVVAPEQEEIPPELQRRPETQLEQEQAREQGGEPKREQPKSQNASDENGNNGSQGSTSGGGASSSGQQEGSQEGGQQGADSQPGDSQSGTQKERQGAGSQQGSGQENLADPGASQGGQQDGDPEQGTQPSGQQDASKGQPGTNQQGTGQERESEAGGDSQSDSSASPNERSTGSGSPAESQGSDGSTQDSGSSQNQQARDEETLKKIQEYLEKQQNNSQASRGSRSGDNANSKSQQQDSADAQPSNQSENDSGNKQGTEQGAPQGEGGKGSDQENGRSEGKQSDKSGSSNNEQNSQQADGEAGRDPSQDSKGSPSDSQSDPPGNPQDGQQGGENDGQRDGQSGEQQRGDRRDQPQKDQGNQKAGDPKGDNQSDSPSSKQGSPDSNEQSGQQSSDRGDPQSGSQGASQDQQNNSQGNQQNSQQGNGETGASEAGQQSGENPGEAPSSGSQSGQQGSNQNSQQSPPQDSSSSGKPGQGQSSRSSDGAPSSGDASAGGEGTPTDPSFADQTTDLTLDYLQRQREQPDPELLREMKWTQKDLNDFLERYRSAKDLKAQAGSIESTSDQLENLKLGKSDNTAVGPSGRADDFRQQLDGGSRVRPPERLRKQIEEFQKALKK